MTKWLVKSFSELENMSIDRFLVTMSMLRGRECIFILDKFYLNCLWNNRELSPKEISVLIEKFLEFGFS